MSTQPNKKLEWVGMIAPVLLTVAYAFEIYEIVKTQDAKELNWVFLSCILAIAVLWIIYGTVNKIRVMQVQAVILLIVNIVLIILKHQYKIQELEKQELEKK
jgi:uncharacterized protein with PQ loop repeat